MPGHRRFPYLGLKRFCRPAGLALAGVAVALLAAQPAAAGDEHFTPRAAISLPNGQKVTSFDIGYVDPDLGGYFLADRTNAAVDGVYVVTNQVTEQLKANFAGIVGGKFNLAGPNGVLTVGHSQLWVGDYGNGENGGNGGLVKVIDLNNGNLLATIATGGFARADELCYDPKDGVVLIANDAEALPSAGGTGPYVTFIGTKGSNQYKVLGKIFMSGLSGQGPLATNGIEQCQWIKKGDKFLLNLPEVNGPGDDSAAGAVLQIDPVKMTITNTFKIAHSECEGPQGMAVGTGPTADEVLLGCNDPNKDVPQTIIISAKDGSTMAVLPNEDGADEVYYNSGDGHFLLGNSGGATGPFLGIVDALTGSGDNSPVTGTGAHSVAADPFTLKVFVPIPSTGGKKACSSVGGDDSEGCILVYKANHPKREVEGE